MTRSNSSELPCVLDECFTKTTLPANNVGMAIRVSCQIGKFHGIIARIGPSVQIVTRDRSQTFADAIRRGAPHALHIADRFHLHMNAMTCLETLLTGEQATLRRVATILRAEHRQAHPAPPPKQLAPERQQSERRARRYARYQQVVHLKAQGWSQRAIAQETGLHPQTVAFYLKAGQFPERAPHAPRGRVIEPYLDYLRQRWQQGEHNGLYWLLCASVRKKPQGERLPWLYWLPGASVPNQAGQELCGKPGP